MKAPLLTLIFALSLPASALALQAQFMPLGDLPGGAVSSIAHSVSADGTVVVGTSSGSLGSEVFRWTASTGMVSLGIIGEGLSVSADGSVIAGTRLTSSGLGAFRWTATTGVVPLGSLPGGGDTSRARGVSGDGTTIVGWAESAAGVEAFRWTAGGGMVGLGDLAGGDFWSQAHGADGTGDTVVGASRSGIETEAFLWTLASGMVDLGGLGGSTSSTAYATTPDGAVIVGEASDPATGASTAFRWTAASGMQPLPTPFSSYGISAAHAVSADGSVIAGGAMLWGFHATLWTYGFGMRYLDDHLMAHGATIPPSWRLERVLGMSTDGSVMVGEGINSEGRQEAWIAHLPPLVGTRYCSPAESNSTGVEARLRLEGSPLAADNDLTVTVTHMPAFRFGYFLASQTQGHVPNAAGGQGTLCVSGEVARFVASIANSGESGTLALALDLQHIPGPSGTRAAVAGETWNFQAWYRDANPAPTSNFSDAMSITFK